MRKLFRALFGEFNWQPPRWVESIATATRHGGAAAGHYARTNPRAVTSIAIAVVVLAAAGIFGWRWYRAQPQPLQVTFTVTPPAVTCYGCEPPGTPNPLIVLFDASTAPLDRAGHDIDADKSGVTVRPQIAGRWTWTDDKMLRFQPAADWPIGQRYEVSFERGFAAAQVRLAEDSFEFVSPAFIATLGGTEFHQDPVVASNKKVVATISFTHPVDPASFESRVRLKMFDRVTDKIEKELRPPAHSVVYDKLKLNAYIHTADLEVPPKAGRLELTIEPGTHAARGGNNSTQTLRTSIEVPGLNSLKISDATLAIARDERNEPNQVLVINTSFSVLERDMPAKVSAWLLPLKHPDPKVQAEFERRRRGQPFAWSSSNFRPEVLTPPAKLELTQIPGEREHYELHSFRYRADPGRFVYMKVESGLKSFGGYVLGDTFERLLCVPQFPRELSILHQGALLSMSGEKTLSLFARNVPAMRVEVGRLLPRQLQHLVTQTSGSFATPQFNNWAFDTANITERFTKTLKLPNIDPGKPQYESLDLGDYLDKDGADRRGIFLLRVQAWHATEDHALEYGSDAWNASNAGALADARLIVVTDLGLVVKKSIDGGNDVFVQSIANGEPVAGATVDIIGRNGLAVLSETTGADGHVHFADMKSFQRERQPVLYLAQRGGDSSFLPFDERGQALDMSRFEIGGVESNADRGALAAYLFSDRGIYRPGEEIHAAAIVRSQDWQKKFAGVPLRLEITDPRGIVIRRETFVPGAAGFGEIRHQTRESSPTGTYTLAISVARNSSLIGSTTVQVRDFQPDRLRMTVGFSAASADGWVSPENLTAQIQLENLFGTPAAQRRLVTQMTLSPNFPSFRKFPDYQFYDPQSAREGFSEALPEAATDEAGKATLQLNLQRFARATYRLHIVSQGFEADGGRGVTAEAAQLVSNMPYLVGYKADGDLTYLPRGTQRKVELIAIDPQAVRTQVEGLKLVRLENRFVSVLLRQPNGTYKYESRRKESILDDNALSIAPGGYVLQLATGTPGNFAYVVQDAAGQQLARFDYQVAGEGNVTRALEKNAELELSLAKSDYAPGESIELSIRAPYAGAGLITIERERVYAWRWFKTTTTSSVQHIELPAGLEGNAYVSVAFVRDPGSSEIYTSPLSYGVKPFSIDVDARRNPLTVKAPTLVKPGETVKISYQTPQPSRVVLFAVDEGILQVANYKTPDPLGHFFQKRSLEVATTQILDLILPEFKHLGLPAAAGGDAEGLLGKHLNPFRRKGEKPVAYWSGILDADATPREVEYTVPDYFNGTLRIIAVAVADDRIGVHESRTLIRGDFVLSPNAPTTVTPGDEFDVSVGVANNAEGSGAAAKIVVGLATDKGLEILGEARQTIVIGEGHESSARFRLRARDELGASAMTFTSQLAAGSTAATRRRIDLSIRPATPYMTVLKAGVAAKGEREVPIERSMYPHLRKLDTGMSVLPLQFAHGFVSYLASYPYACTEQIVSQAMPAVLLASRPEFGYVKTLNGGDLSALIGELRSRQNDAGAYKLWPGSDQVAEFVSLYAQHLLLEAGQRGQAIPADLIETGNSYLRRIAARDGNNLTEERQSAYAIYLMTRQGQRMTAEIAAARKRLTQRYRGQWEQDLTAAWLAAALDLMKQDDDANQLIGKLRFSAVTSQEESESYNDPMTRDALLLFVIAQHFPERLRSIPDDVLATMATRIDTGFYHSLSAGTTLLALDAYAKASEGTERNFAIAEVLKDKRVRSLALPEGLFPKTAFSDQATGLRFANNTALNAYYSIDESGFDRKPPTTAIKQGLEVLREYTDDQGKPLAKTGMGDQVEVHLKFRKLEPGYIGDIAMVDLLPGGFELVVPSQPAQTTFAESNAEATAAQGRETSEWQCQICIASNAHLSYADMREDRVVFYVSASDQVAEIVYRIKATNVGTYTTPPAYGEAMYDRKVVARSTSGKLTVERK